MEAFTFCSPRYPSPQAPPPPPNPHPLSPHPTPHSTPSTLLPSATRPVEATSVLVLMTARGVFSLFFSLCRSHRPAFVADWAIYLVIVEFFLSLQSQPSSVRPHPSAARPRSLTFPHFVEGEDVHLHIFFL